MPRLFFPKIINPKTQPITTTTREEEMVDGWRIERTIIEVKTNLRDIKDSLITQIEGLQETERKIDEHLATIPAPVDVEPAPVEPAPLPVDNIEP